MCWIKGVLLEIAVAVTIAVGLALIALLMAGIFKLITMLTALMPRHRGLPGRVGNVLFFVLVGGLLCMIFGMTTYLAKDNVCHRGFVGGYKAVWAALEK